jgi:hypothetical protein
MAIQRERELLLFFASILNKVNDPDVRSQPHNYPTFHLLWQHCTADAIRARSELEARMSANRRRKSVDPHSILDQFYMRIRAWNQTRLINGSQCNAAPIHHLPVDHILTDRPGRGIARQSSWDVQAFKRAVQCQSIQYMKYMWLLSTRGLSLHDHPSSRYRLRDIRPTIGDLKGVHLPPLLGIPDAVAAPSDIFDAAANPMIPSSPSPSLTMDTRYHATLRTRVALNRESSFLAVKYYHTTNRVIDISCPYCQDPDVPHTALHAITQCPRYAVRRAQLKRRIAAVIIDIRQRASIPGSPMHTILTHDDIIFMHLVLCTPYIFSNLPSDRPSRLRFLRLTGSFLEYIHNIQPD